MSEWLQGLNPEQQEAVLHTEGPMLILAGAGSGKTTVLVARAGRMITESQISPTSLCVLTFTNKAARELKSRVSHRVGVRGEKIWAGTFHAFGCYLLRKHAREAGLSPSFGILDASDAQGICKELLRDFKHYSKAAFDMGTLMERLSRRREAPGNSKSVDEYDDAAEWLLPKYLARLNSLGVVDFDDLILKPLELLKTSDAVRTKVAETWQYFMVDEFQDTNKSQMEWLNYLVKPHRNLAVVGDDDQAIYGWRGACVRNILDFPKYYSGCKIVRLEKNYRSTSAILNTANALIAKNKDRYNKVLHAVSQNTVEVLPEVFVYENEVDEAEQTVVEIARLHAEGRKFQEMAVLYRSNGQGALIEAQLRGQNIPYRMSGGTAFFDRKEIRDILAYLRTALSPHEVALRRILNTPSRGLGDQTYEDLSASAEQSGMPFVVRVRHYQGIGLNARVEESLAGFWKAVDGLLERLLDPHAGNVGAVLMQFLSEIEYRSYLSKISSTESTVTKRWKVIETFAGVLERYLEKGGRTRATLTRFLEAMDLRDALEDAEDNPDKVQLLTLHASKGLEFAVVLLIGVEEDIIPHRSLGTDISEERRLFYVGITRAKERLILSRARMRQRHGKWLASAPSRFLLELPQEGLQNLEGGRPVSAGERRSMVADLFKKIDSLNKTMPRREPV